MHFDENEPIKVSVAIIAYNVDKYIKMAIDSVLDQDVNFRVEIVVGEDCSTDATREIVLDYHRHYPSIVKPLLHDKNIGLTANSIATQNHCAGEYIALLDGDDYWSCKNKLKIQIEFLDINIDYSGSGHQSEIIFDDIIGDNRLFGESFDSDYVVTDMISHRKFHTSSLVYRSKFWFQSGGFPATISSNERALYPMLAIFGKIKYFGLNMCIYRRSSIGLSNRLKYVDLETDYSMLPWLRSLDESFPILRFRSFLHLCNFTYPSVVPSKIAFKHFLLFILYSFSYFPDNLRDVKWGLIWFAERIRRNLVI